MSECIPEMVSKVAKAIIDAIAANAHRISREATDCDLGQARAEVAIAAIEAMREPTSPMLDAIWSETGDPCWRYNAKKAWQAGISVALGTETWNPITERLEIPLDTAPRDVD